MHSVITNSTKVKYVFHSAHDKNLASMNGYLNLVLNTTYNSPVINNGANFRVRIIYNDDSIYEDEFEKFTSNTESRLVPQSFLKKICSIESIRINLLQNIISILEVLTILLLLAIVYLNCSIALLKIKVDNCCLQTTDELTI